MRKGERICAPGYRDAGNYRNPGNLINVGRDGFSRSGTPNTNNIEMLYLGFYTQGLNPTSSDFRAHGFQLRCLSE
ncbi:hypothetical protein [uncultured Rikenella sp.]|uniref:hypothetical protein n=1 Tax=uncultured Rikenella sp. TaxID=368003 RepID=UPI0025F7ED06|nr:hypothetical protein [uncultured Rikenella sp.]